MILCTKMHKPAWLEVHKDRRGGFRSVLKVTASYSGSSRRPIEHLPLVSLVHDRPPLGNVEIRHQQGGAEAWRSLLMLREEPTALALRIRRRYAVARPWQSPQMLTATPISARAAALTDNARLAPSASGP